MNPCALCSATTKLERSHGIPQFVYRGLREPGVPALPLLCGTCEDRFSLWKSQFARDVFHPLVAGKAVSVKYGPWLLKFAASVCWRLLETARCENRLGAIQPDDCLRTWRDFLRGRRPDVGAHHLSMARGAGRRIDSAVAGEKDAAWVSVEMGPVILRGLVQGDGSAGWEGVRIHLEGKLKPRRTDDPGPRPLERKSHLLA